MGNESYRSRLDKNGLLKKGLTDKKIENIPVELV